MAFRDSTGKVWMLIETTGTITIMNGYAWNGCSPKFCLFDILLGTPDGVVHRETGKPKTYFASLVHDALYQFLTDGLPLNRRHADAIFLQLLRESDFTPARIYWLAVRLFGWLVRHGTAMKRQWHGNRLHIDELISG
jgi:hypothetical protein